MPFTGLNSSGDSVIWLLTRYAADADFSLVGRLLTNASRKMLLLVLSMIVPDNRVITAYRCHPYAVMRGGTITGVIAELLGRQDDMPRAKGKGGSMHIFTPFSWELLPSVAHLALSISLVVIRFLSRYVHWYITYYIGMHP